MSFFYGLITGVILALASVYLFVVWLSAFDEGKPIRGENDT